MTLDRFVLTHLNAISGLMKMAYDKICTNTNNEVVEEKNYESQVVIKNNKLLLLNDNSLLEDNKVSIKNNDEEQKYKIDSKHNNEIEKNTKIKRSLFENVPSTSLDEKSSDDDYIMSDDSIIEEENWRGQGNTLKAEKQYLNKNKKIRPTKYMDKCTEIKGILNNTKLRSSKNTYLLNGNK